MTINMNGSSHFVDPLLKQALHSFLESHKLIGRDQETHFVVAYSGGRDSTTLLHCLAQLQAELPTPIKLTVAYYWHPWRPLEEDIEVIHKNCKALGIPWVMLTPDLTLPKTETAAREDRYQQLAKLTHDLTATALLTAHHQDDQVETVLFRILRGTGLDGIKGIPEMRELWIDEVKHVTLARPFIHQPRNIINAFAQENNLTYANDPTNMEIRIKRNLIRHELLPQIEAAFPNARQSILKLSELTTGDLEIVEKKIDEIWSEVFDPKEQSLDEVRFNQLSHAFQRRIIRKFLEYQTQETSFNKIEDILAFIAGKNRKLPSPALFSLDASHFLSVYRNKITIEAPQEKEISPVSIPIPGAISHLDLKATLSIVPLSGEAQQKPIDFSQLSEEEVYVDLSQFEGKELTLRSRMKGDRIKPLGMSESVKLKRYFINRCIPRFKRDTVPLLTSESDVLWAVGVGLSESIRVKNRPTHLITIKRGLPSD